jgi:hypothetical protein
MCRSIKQLRQSDQTPTEDEIRAAALQFVRKVAAIAPSRANKRPFNKPCRNRCFYAPPARQPGDKVRHSMKIGGHWRAACKTCCHRLRNSTSVAFSCVLRRHLDLALARGLPS